MKAEPTRFSNSLCVGCLRKSRVKKDYKVICSNNWKGLELPVTEIRKAASGAGLGDGDISKNQFWIC